VCLKEAVIVSTPDLLLFCPILSYPILFVPRLASIPPYALPLFTSYQRNGVGRMKASV